MTGLCRVQCGGSTLSGLQVSFPGLLPLFTNFTALSSASLALVHWFCTATFVKQLLLFHDQERNFYKIDINSLKITRRSILGSDGMKSDCFLDL